MLSPPSAARYLSASTSHSAPALRVGQTCRIRNVGQRSIGERTAPDPQPVAPRAENLRPGGRYAAHRARPFFPPQPENWLGSLAAQSLQMRQNCHYSADHASSHPANCDTAFTQRLPMFTSLLVMVEVMVRQLCRVERGHGILNFADWIDVFCVCPAIDSKPQRNKTDTSVAFACDAAPAVGAGFAAPQWASGRVISALP